MTVLFITQGIFMRTFTSLLNQFILPNFHLYKFLKYEQLHNASKRQCKLLPDPAFLATAQLQYYGITHENTIKHICVYRT